MISLITVTHNSKETTYKYIKSLIANLGGGHSYEIILVDNGSQDGSYDFFTKLTGQIVNLKYHYQNDNLGFSKANNIGVKSAKGEIICFINPDIEIIQPGLFEWIVQNLTDGRSVIAPQIKYPSGEIQPNGGTPLTLANFILQSLRVGQRLRKYKLINKIGKIIFPDYFANFRFTQQPRTYPWLSGAFLVLRKNQFTEVGGFDENFFLYCEDADLCERLSAKFGDCVLCPSYTVVHEEGFKKAKSGGGLSLVERSRLQSNIYYLNKNGKGLQAFFLKCYYIIRFWDFLYKSKIVEPTP